MNQEELREEIKKCISSPAYFFKKYCKLTDKEGNELPKPDLTDEQVNRAIEIKSKWGKIETRYPLTGEETEMHFEAFMRKFNGGLMPKHNYDSGDYIIE